MSSFPSSPACVPRPLYARSSAHCDMRLASFPRGADRAIRSRALVSSLPFCLARNRPGVTFPGTLVPFFAKLRTRAQKRSRRAVYYAVSPNCFCFLYFFSIPRVSRNDDRRLYTECPAHNVPCLLVINRFFGTSHEENPNTKMSRLQ